MVIYKAINKVNGKSYIGQTCRDLMTRKRAHKHDALKRDIDMVFYKAVRKYGWESFEWETLYEVGDDDPELLDRLERRAISEHNPEYNVRGGGQCGYRHSEETKEKIGMGNLNNPKRGKRYIIHTPEGEEYIINNLSEFCRENDLLENGMAQVANGYALTHKGYQAQHHDFEDRQRAEKTREGMSQKTGTSLRHKTITLNSPDGYKVIIENISQFCIEEGLSKGAISLVAKGKRKSHKGWTLSE